MALSWVLPDEVSAKTQAIRSDIEAGLKVFIPYHWTLEIANALWMAERRKRISPADTAAALAAFKRIPMETDTETGQRAGGETMAIARQHALSVYDAAYVELALRQGASLASLDETMRGAARKLKVRLLPEGL